MYFKTNYSFFIYNTNKKVKLLTQGYTMGIFTIALCIYKSMDIKTVTWPRLYLVALYSKRARSTCVL